MRALMHISISQRTQNSFFTGAKRNPTCKNIGILAPNNLCIYVNFLIWDPVICCNVRDLLDDKRTTYAVMILPSWLRKKLSIYASVPMIGELLQYWAEQELQYA